jgi:hypothetical protein
LPWQRETFLPSIGIFRVRAWHLTKAGPESVKVGFSNVAEVISTPVGATADFLRDIGKFQNENELSLRNLPWTGITVA